MAQEDDAQLRVSGGANVLSEHAVALLQRDSRLHELVCSMRASDACCAGVASSLPQPERQDAPETDVARQRFACQKSIVETIEELGFRSEVVTTAPSVTTVPSPERASLCTLGALFDEHGQASTLPPCHVSRQFTFTLQAQRNA